MAEETEVVLSANTQPYERSVDQATSATNKMLDAVMKLTTAIDGAFKSVGKTMQIGGTGMAAGLVAMGVAAGKLDSQMSQLQGSMTMVAKGEAEATRRIKDYDKAVTSLRGNFGMTSAEAIGLVSQLNKMGQSSQNVDKLAQSFVKLSAVTGEGVGQLAQNMTQLQRTMGTEGVTQTENFNATLAKLSQTAGVSATAITQFSQSIAPIGKVSGMTQKELMGVSTAFVKAGADGFAASNTFNKMLTDITRSIQYGSPELKAYADLIGVSVENFKEMPRSEAITQIFEQINKQGPQAIKTLERFGLDGVRSMKAIQAVAGQGGIRGAISEAMSPSDTGKLDEASGKSFENLNHEMSKIAENAKMIGEAFGKGVLPVLEGVARAFNLILSPLNAVLQAMGKLPGGFAMGAAAAVVAAGTILKAFTGLSTVGLLKGAGTTALQGIRMGKADRLAAEGDPSGIFGLNPKDRAVWEERQKFRRGEDALGSPFHHAMYAGYERLGGLAGAAGENLGDTPSRWKANLSTAAAWTTQTAGQFARSGLDPLSRQAWENNLNRDKAVQGMPKADVYNALGYQRVKDAWREYKDSSAAPAAAGDAGGGFWGKLKDSFGSGEGGGGDKGVDSATRKYVRGVNTAHDSTLRMNKGIDQAGRELRLFGAALGRASLNTAQMVGRGTLYAGARGGAMLGRGAMGAMNMMGGPAALGMMAGTAAVGALWNQHKQSDEAVETALNNQENTSAFSKYAAAVGEATLATKSFSDVMKEAKDSAAAKEKYSPKPTASVVEQTKTGGGKYSNKDIESSNYKETKAIVDTVMAGNPSDDMKRAIQRDLMLKYGTDEEGQRITENVMRQAQNNSGLDMTPLMTRAMNKNPWYQVLGSSTESVEAGKSVGDTAGEQIFRSGANRQEQAQGILALLNMAYKSTGTGLNSGDAGTQKSIATAVAGGVLRGSSKPEDVQHVIDAFQMSSGLGGDQSNFTEVQNRLAGDDSDIGKAIKQAIEDAGPGWDRTSTRMPNSRAYANPWLERTGLDQSTLDRLQGVTMDRSLMPGTSGYMVDTQKGDLNTLATNIFGGNANVGLGLKVSTAMSQEANQADQWTGMKAISDEAIRVAPSFSAATAAVDQMTAAVQGTNPAFEALLAAARASISKAQSEAMPYMSERGRYAELVGNYGQALATNARTPTKESGAQLDAARDALKSAEIQKKEDLKSFATQVRSFNISRERGEKAFNLSRKYAQDDYDQQREWSEKNFQKQRLRQEENFHHQQEQMTKQTARSMTDIYAKVNVERTWDAANLYQNMLDQQTKLAEHQANLAKLRKAGLTDDTIEQMGLNDPAKMQQAARLADTLAGDPKLVAGFNKLTKDRMTAAGKIVTDASNNQWTEMQYAFNKSMKQSAEDYKTATDQQDVQFKNSMKRQQDAFSLSQTQMQEDMDTSMTSITDNMGELQRIALGALTGTAKTQMTNILNDINGIAPLITGKVDTTTTEVENLFKKLGIPPLPRTNAQAASATAAYAEAHPDRLATGGPINGYSPHPKADNIHVMATAGEYMQPVDAVNFYGKDFMDAVRAKKIPRFADGGMVYKDMEAWMGKNLPKVQITSSYRDPGRNAAVGGSKTSMHLQGKALDLAPSMDTFNAILSAFGSKIYQLFYAPAGGRSILKGKPWNMPPALKADHWDHVHWAMQSMDGLAGFTGSGAAGGWDGTPEALLKEVQKLASVKAFDKGMNKSLMYQTRAMGKDWLAKAIVRAGMARMQGSATGVDADLEGMDSVATGPIQQMVQRKAAALGWTGGQWSDLAQLVKHESSWNPKAQNPGSTAYGLFQFLNSTWGSVGGHKTSDPALQADYGLKYVKQRYGNPSKAWDFWNSHTPHWYGEGAVFDGKKTIGVGENGPEAVLPLNASGVDFLFEVMKRNSSESKRALIAAGGVPMQGNSTNYYAKIDKSTNITGPITVQSQDPDDMIRKLQAKKAIEAMKGRHG